MVARCSEVQAVKSWPRICRCDVGGSRCQDMDLVSMLHFVLSLLFLSSQQASNHHKCKVMERPTPLTCQAKDAPLQYKYTLSSKTTESY